MLSYPTSLNLITLLEEARALSYKDDDSGAKMAYRQSTKIASNSPFQIAADEIKRILGLEPIFITLNILPAGVTVPVHTDTLVGGRKNRWHLPLITNPDCFFWDEINGQRHLPYGFWSGPIPHWINHNVWNHGVTERIHLVVDLQEK